MRNYVTFRKQAGLADASAEVAFDILNCIASVGRLDFALNKAKLFSDRATIL